MAERAYHIPVTLSGSEGFTEDEAVVVFGETWEEAKTSLMDMATVSGFRINMEDIETWPGE
jgi:hypothetical protein